MESADAATVIGLFTAPAAGQEMESRNCLDLVAGLGIPGDRYATRLGHWSDPRWKDQELTLVGVELLDELHLGLADLRRNIVTRGVELLALIDLEFSIGSARLVGKRECSPCGYIEGFTRPGLLSVLHGRGGLRAAIVGSGRVTVGDEFRLIDLAVTG